MLSLSLKTLSSGIHPRYFLYSFDPRCLSGDVEREAVAMTAGGMAHVCGFDVDALDERCRFVVSVGVSVCVGVYRVLFLFVTALVAR